MTQRLRGFFASLLMVGLAGLATVSDAEALVYFVGEDGSLGRADYDAGEVQTTFPTGFAAQGKREASLIETDGSYLYNVHRGSNASQTLQRVAMNGTQPTYLYNLPSAASFAPATALEISGNMAYVQYARYTGNGDQVFANRLGADGSGLDDTWAPALNGDASCAGGPNVCFAISDIAVDEASRSAYWVIMEIVGFLDVECRIMRVSLDDSSDSAITVVHETRMRSGEDGQTLEAVFAGDGHLYWTGEAYTAATDTRSGFLGHASTSDHLANSPFVPGSFQGVGVLNGDLYASGAIIRSNGTVDQRAALPAGSKGSAVDPLTSFPAFQPCVVAGEDTAKALAQSTKLAKKLKKAKKRVRSAEKKLARAEGKAEKAKATAKLRKAKAAVLALTKKVKEARESLQEMREFEFVTCNSR